MKVVGKYTVKLRDRRGDLVDVREGWNVITDLGRQRIIDIWSNTYNLNDPWDKRIYGVSEIDMSPRASGLAKCTFWDVDTESNTNGYNTCDSFIGSGPTGPSGDSDDLFDPTKDVVVEWTEGVGSNGNHEYYHVLEFFRQSTEDYINVTALQVPHDLTGSRLRSSTANNDFTVQNNAKTITYTYNTDYTFDRENGTITFLSGGAISPSDNVYVSYKWHNLSPDFQDGIVGMRLDGWTGENWDFLYHRSWFGDGKYSFDGNATWELEHFPWYGKPEGHYYDNYRTESEDYHVFQMFQPRRTNSGFEHWFFNFPYVAVNPTSMRFRASFTYGPWFFKRWRFYKPNPQPQVPQALALGTGNSAESTSNTALDVEVIRLPIDGAGGTGIEGIARWTAYLDYNQGNGVTFKEIGLFFGDEWKSSQGPGWTYFAPPSPANCDKLFSRSVFGTPWSKDSGQSAEITYEITLTQ